ncbi:hypothetical protein PTSG_11829 [Salpingoeca rosetta]|uniref:Uncharacterized protein n=1 Tax=Salpingoeca rosetta (strain ATCC 50818 / BSB-021) TaxID=946362 RepID=F2TZS0_SALR5|nr:uncharacterized protein PTSG_11829 [Salpingoeca rosetta]EGD79094.1 hypothetical protein PTSG_11829 [Salpingoeca rosetta]|eukprot:XP_004998050.1 hypothetical protein PTSG_11829 [Salpingoeca rosetta]
MSNVLAGEGARGRMLLKKEELLASSPPPLAPIPRRIIISNGKPRSNGVKGDAAGDGSNCCGASSGSNSNNNTGSTKRSNGNGDSDDSADDDDDDEGDDGRETPTFVASKREQHRGQHHNGHDNDSRERSEQMISDSDDSADAIKSEPDEVDEASSPADDNEESLEAQAAAALCALKHACPVGVPTQQRPVSSRATSARRTQGLQPQLQQQPQPQPQLQQQQQQLPQHHVQPRQQQPQPQPHQQQLQQLQQQQQQQQQQHLPQHHVQPRQQQPQQQQLQQFPQQQQQQLQQLQQQQQQQQAWSVPLPLFPQQANFPAHPGIAPSPSVWPYAPNTTTMLAHPGMASMGTAAPSLRQHWPVPTAAVFPVRTTAPPPTHVPEPEPHNTQTGSLLSTDEERLSKLLNKRKRSGTLCKMQPQEVLKLVAVDMGRAVVQRQKNVRTGPKCDFYFRLGALDVDKPTFKVIKAALMELKRSDKHTLAQRYVDERRKLQNQRSQAKKRSQVHQDMHHCKQRNAVLRKKLDDANRVLSALSHLL